MQITIASDLSRLDIYAERFEQTAILGIAEPSEELVPAATFYEPVLVTDNAAIGRLVPGIRDAVFALYASFPRTVSYDGTAVSWAPERYRSVWCPSIDTVFFARTLARYLGEDVRAVAEIGTGSGFLTKFMLERLAGVERAVATDINIEAIRCAYDATKELANASVLSLLKVEPDAPRLGLVGSFDLLISNPPYIPRPSAHNDNPYEGLDLVAKLVREAGELLAEDGAILLNISSLAGEEPLFWFGDAGYVVEPLETMRVPLKVNTVTSQLSDESREWLAYLKQKRTIEDVGIDEGDACGYRYWHQLRMFEIRRG